MSFGLSTYSNDESTFSEELYMILKDNHDQTDFDRQLFKAWFWNLRNIPANTLKFHRDELKKLKLDEWTVYMQNNAVPSE